MNERIRIRRRIRQDAEIVCRHTISESRVSDRRQRRKREVENELVCLQAKDLSMKPGVEWLDRVGVDHPALRATGKQRRHDKRKVVRVDQA